MLISHDIGLATAIGRQLEAASHDVYHVRSDKRDKT